MGMKLSGVVLRVDGGEQAQKTLDKVGNAIKKNRQEMAKLEATYGKNSKDTNYLAQRSSLMQKQLEQQRKATQALRETREKYVASGKASEEQLGKLDMQILRSETSERQLERGIRECNAAMEAQKSAAAGAADAVNGASDKLDKGKKSWDEYAKSVEKAGEKLEKAGGKMSRYVTTPVLGMGVTAGKLAMDLEDSIYEVATLPGVLTGSIEEQQKQVDEYRRLLIDASNLSGAAATDLAAAQYQAVSAGISVEDSIYWAQRAAMAAKGGRSDAETVVSGASSVFNAWGQKSGGLDHILDVMMTAQNRGKTDVGQLASQIGQVTGMAPQLGVGMEEVFAAIAAMTLGGMSTSGSVTGLKAVMSSVIKPTAEAREEAERLGLSFDAAALQAKGLTGFLQDVADKTGMDVESLGKLFGSVEGLNQVLALGTSAAEDYASILQEMEGASGVVDQAFETRVSSRAEQLAASMNRLKNAGAEFGEALLPAVDMGAEMLESVSGAIAGLDDGSKRAVITLGALAAATGPVLKITGTLMKNLTTILSVLRNPYVAAGIGIAALTTTLVTANEPARRLQEALDGIDVTLSEEAKSNIAQGINDGVAAAQQDWEIYCKARVTVDGTDVQQQLTDMVQTALSDSMVTLGEKTQLEGLRDTMLAPLIASGTQEGGIVGLLAGDLQAAVDEFYALLEVVYREGNSATDDEIASLETAMGKVRELAGEMLQLRTDIDGAEKSLQGKAGVTVAGGYGDLRTVGDAAAYTVYTAAQLQAEISDNLEVSRKAAQDVTGSADATKAEKDAAQAAYDSAQADADARSAQVQADMEAALAAQWSGWTSRAGNAGAMADITKAGQLLDVLSAIQAVQQMPGSVDVQEELRRRIAPGTLEALGYGYFADSEGLFDSGNAYPVTAMQQLQRDASEAFKEMQGSINVEDNPATAMLQAWMDAGVDVSALDLSAMPETIQDALRISMVDADPASIGTEAMEAIGQGITEGGEGTAEDAGEAGAKVGAALGNVGDTRAVGLAAARGLGMGISLGTPEAVNAASTLAAGVNAALAGAGSVRPGVRGAATGAGSSVDNSVNVNIQHADMRGEEDVSGLAGRIAAYSRGAAFGLGIG